MLLLRKSRFCSKRSSKDEPPLLLLFLLLLVMAALLLIVIIMTPMIWAAVVVGRLGGCCPSLSAVHVHWKRAARIWLKNRVRQKASVESKAHTRRFRRLHATQLDSITMMRKTKNRHIFFHAMAAKSIQTWQMLSYPIQLADGCVSPHTYKFVYL